MNHHTHKHDHLLQVYWQRTDLSGGLAIQNAEPSISFVRVPASTFPLVPAPTGEFLIPVLSPNVELRDLGAGAVALRGELPSRLESTVAGAGIAGGGSDRQNLPNIVSYDFVNPESSQQIVALNEGF